MKAVTANPRTADQNRKLWWLAGQLGIDKEAMADVVWDFTEGRTCHTSELSFLEARDLIDYLNRTLSPKSYRDCSSAKTDRYSPEHPDRVQLDRKRKGVIKAIFRWFELLGQHPTMEYVKAVACRAAGKDRFNDISLGELTRIYAEFCHKQKSQSAMRNVELGIAMQN